LRISTKKVSKKTYQIAGAILGYIHATSTDVCFLFKKFWLLSWFLYVILISYDRVQLVLKHFNFHYNSAFKDFPHKKLNSAEKCHGLPVKNQNWSKFGLSASLFPLSRLSVHQSGVTIFFSLKSPWDDPRPPGLTPGGAWARFNAGKFSLEGAHEAGTF